jgi:hypothetical protein
MAVGPCLAEKKKKKKKKKKKEEKQTNWSFVDKFLKLPSYYIDLIL